MVTGCPAGGQYQTFSLTPLCTVPGNKGLAFQQGPCFFGYAAVLRALPARVIERPHKTKVFSLFCGREPDSSAAARLSD
jgi:hypothetical protein